MPTVGMLHTSLVFVKVEPMIRDMFREILPDIRVLDFVDGDVLATVQREGYVSPASVRRMCHLAQAAEDAGVAIIFSACSSLGPAIDVVRQMARVPVIKIDDAMAQEAVRKAERIGILATVPSTLTPTITLIRDAAATAQRTVTVMPRLCEGAFEILMGGDRPRHDDMVSEACRQLGHDVELIVLAQASMGRLAPRLTTENDVEVLASPRSGVESVAALLRAQSPQVNGNQVDSRSSSA